MELKRGGPPRSMQSDYHAFRPGLKFKMRFEANRPPNILRALLLTIAAAFREMPKSSIRVLHALGTSPQDASAILQQYEDFKLGS